MDGCFNMVDVSRRNQRCFKGLCGGEVDQLQLDVGELKGGSLDAEHVC